MNNIKHIIWDFNGTLLDDVWLCVDIINQLLIDRNIPILTVQQYREIFDFPVKNYYQKAGFDFSVESFEKVGLEFIEKYDERHYECKLHSYVSEILSFFAKRSYNQMVLSARRTTELEDGITFLGIAKYFSGIYGLNDQYAAGKTELGIQLINKMNINPQEILFIGDTIHDYEVAKQIQTNCILIANGHQLYDKLKQTNCMVYNNLKDFYFSDRIFTQLSL